MNVEDAYYIYLLKDPRIDDPLTSIFYVGKGKGLRADQHRREALWGHATIAEFDADAQSVSRKDALLRELEAAGLEPTIELLVGPDGGGVSEDRAYAGEAALIEVLRAGGRLTNVRPGDTLRLTSGASAFRSHDVQRIELPDEFAAVVVPVNGIWGGRDVAGTMLAASDDEIWGNARRTWSSCRG